MDILKQSIGIDISKSDFSACYCRLNYKQEASFSKSRKFENNPKGFKNFIAWAEQQTRSDLPCNFLMEATGVYYESLAYFLYENGHNLHVLLPNKIKNYFRSLNIKTKTDKIDAKYIAQFAAERRFPQWEPAPASMKRLRSLTRHYNQLQEQKTVFRNILHSVLHSCGSDELVEKSNKVIIEQIEHQIKECKNAIQALIKQDSTMKEKFDNVTTITGVGLITAAIVVAETQGFKMFKNSKQLVSYSGYDVVENQSGSSIRGKTRISKKGNKYIRKAMYFPAITAVQRSDYFKKYHKRIFERRYISMVSYVAVQRKLLVLIYTLWKNDEVYDEKRSSLT